MQDGRDTATAGTCPRGHSNVTTAYRFDVITLFGEMMRPYFEGSILGRAAVQGLVSVGYTNPRDFTTDVHRTVDDTPFGGGAGMLMKPEPIALAVEQVRQLHSPERVVLMSPSGRVFDQNVAREYAQLDGLALICGRYEGVDERVARHVADEELSIGDFVLTGGELAAMAVIDAVSRMLPGVLGHARGAQEESFTDAPLLEFPQFTRPRNWRGHEVPEVLLSGHHSNIDRWRQQQREERTKKRRPDLWRGRKQTTPSEGT